MRVRTAAVLAVMSALTATAAPAFGYWSQPVEIEVELQAGQVGAPTKLETSRDSAQMSSVTLTWQEPQGSAVPVTGYRVERAELSGATETTKPAWAEVPAEPTCDGTGLCTVTDLTAPSDALYRVASRAGAWRSAPTEEAFSLVVGGVRQGQTPAPTNGPTNEPTTATTEAADPGAVETEGCPDGEVWTFAVPQEANLRDVRRGALVFSPFMPSGVQLVSEVGSVDLVPGPDGTITVPRHGLLADILLRVCPSAGADSLPGSGSLFLDGSSPVTP